MSGGPTGNFDLDQAYLRTTVAAPLTAAMAQLAILQPEDPVEFLGNYLLKFVANELEAQRVMELKKDQQWTSSSAVAAGAQQQVHDDSNNGDGVAQNPKDELEQVCRCCSNYDAIAGVCSCFVLRSTAVE